MANDIVLNLSLEEREALRSLGRLTKSTNQFTKKAVRGLSKLNLAFSSFAGNLASRAVISGISKLNSGIAEVTRRGRDFSRGVGEINTLLPKNARLTEDLTEKFIKFSDQFGSKISDQTKAFYQIVSAGIKNTAVQMDFLSQSSKASIAGLSSVETAADLVTSAFNVFGVSGETAGSIFDKVFVGIREGKTTFEELAASLGQVNAIASSAGANFSEVVGTLAALTKAGIRTDIAIRGLRQIFVNVIKISKQAKDQVGELGIEFNTAALRTKGLVKFLRELAIAAKGNESKLANLFGNIRALNPILKLVRGNFSDFNRIVNEVTKSTGAMSEAFKVMERTFDFQLTRASTLLKNIALRVFNDFVPAMNEGTKAYNRFLENLGTKTRNITFVFAGFGKAINSLVVKPIEAIGNAGDAILLALELRVKKTVSTIGSLAQGVGVILAGLGVETKLAAQLIAFKVFADKLEKETLDKFSKKLEQTFTFSGELGNKIDKFFDDVTNNAAKNGTKLANVVNLAAEQAKQMRDAILGALQFGPDTPESPFESLLADMTEFQEAFVNIMGAGFEGTEKQFTKFVKTTKKFAKTIRNTLMQGVANGAGQAFAAFGRAIVEGANPLKAFIDEFLKSMGQMAIQVGTMFILQGVASLIAGLPNGPALIAAGAALATFGGVLGAVLGGKTAPATGTGQGSVGGGGLDDQSGDFLPGPETEIQTQRKTEINVRVEGNIFDSTETGLKIVDVIKDSIEKDGAIFGVTLV